MKFCVPFLCSSRRMKYTTTIVHAMTIGAMYSITLDCSDLEPDSPIIRNFSKHASSFSPHTINSATLIKAVIDVHIKPQNNVYSKKFDCVLDQRNITYTFELPHKKAILEIHQSTISNTSELRYTFGPYTAIIEQKLPFNQTIVIDEPMSIFLQEHALVNPQEHVWTRPLLMRTITTYLNNKRSSDTSEYTYDKPIFDLFGLTEDDILPCHRVITHVNKHVQSIEQLD